MVYTFWAGTKTTEGIVGRPKVDGVPPAREKYIPVEGNNKSIIQILLIVMAHKSNSFGSIVWLWFVDVPLLAHSDGSQVHYLFFEHS